jgi:membrane protein
VIRDLNKAAKRQVKDSLQRYADRSETAGWLGLVIFVGVLVFLLHDVEDAFNFLWKIPKARPLRAQILLYSSLLLGVPLLMAAAVGAQAWMVERGPFGTLLEGWIPGFLGMWMAWAVVLKWVPNIRVKCLPAAWGAFLALLLFEATRWGLGASFEYLVGSFRFYGAIWMMPVILIWFFVGWMILLFGVEVAYFTQLGWSDARHPGGGSKSVKDRS